jgi:hypothetical protein
LASVNEQLLTAIDRFVGNEERVQQFVNAIEPGFYRTNLTPSRQVETLAHFMERISNRFSSLVMRGLWKPGTEYAVNDVFRSPEDGSYWISGVPHVSGADFAEDAAEGKITLFGNRADTSQAINFRVSFRLEEAVPSGGELYLKAFYPPGRHCLVLSVNGEVLVPSQPDLAGTAVPGYEEIFVDGEPLSNTVRMRRNVGPGSLVDVFVFQSTLGQRLAEMILLAAEAAASAEAAEGSSEAAADWALQAQAAYSSSYAAVGEGNAREAWLAPHDVEPGEILQLPINYLPGRDVLLLWYNGAACVPRKAGVEESGNYSYEECAPEDGGESSSRVKVHFPVREGDVLDAMAVVSGLTRHKEEIEAAKAAAEAARDSASGSADAAAGSASAAAGSAASAAASAEAAGQSAEDLAEAVNSTLKYRGQFADFYDVSPSELSGAFSEGDKAFKRDGSEISEWSGGAWGAGPMQHETFDWWLNRAEDQGYFWFVDRWKVLDFKADLSLKEDVSNRTDAPELDQQFASSSKYPSEKGLAAALAEATGVTPAAVRAGAVTAALIPPGSPIEVPFYKVGSNRLLVFWDGVLCEPGTDGQYVETGDPGDQSNFIESAEPVPEGTLLTFMVI